MKARSQLADEVIEELSKYDFNFASESELQNGIWKILSKSHSTCQKEIALSKRDRPDFVIERLAIEVKVKGSRYEVLRQISRYLQSEKIDEVLLVTSKASHRGMPHVLYGKAIRVLYLSRM